MIGCVGITGCIGAGVICGPIGWVIGLTPDMRSGTVGPAGRDGCPKSPSSDCVGCCIPPTCDGIPPCGDIPPIRGCWGIEGMGGIGGFAGAGNACFGGPVGLSDPSKDGGRTLGTSIPCSFKLIILQAIENSLRSSFPSALQSAKDHICPSTGGGS